MSWSVLADFWLSDWPFSDPAAFSPHYPGPLTLGQHSSQAGGLFPPFAPGPGASPGGLGLGAHTDGVLTLTAHSPASGALFPPFAPGPGASPGSLGLGSHTSNTLTLTPRTILPLGS